MKIVLEISYIGTNYNGWQKQSDEKVLSIQKIIEQAYFKKLNEQIILTASGRTDAGVHAFKQVAHFETNLDIPPEKFANIINSNLPNDIHIIKSYKTTESFHARFDVKRKTYCYKLYTKDKDNPFYVNRAEFISDLNLSLMKKCAKVFIGKHDFTSFCKASSNNKNCERIIYSINISKEKNNIINIKICGNGFLHNMVRIICGALILCGQKKLTKKGLAKILEDKKRSTFIKTLPPHGLYLENVEY